MGQPLSWYLSDAASLLRDSLHIFTSTQQLTRWINQSRRQAARRTGCIRCLITGQSQYGGSSQPGFFVPGAAIPGNLPNAAPGSGSTNLFQTIPGVESYPFQGFGNSFLQAQYQGADQITDIVDNAVQWGVNSYRPVLNWCPWEEMQSYMRAWSVLNSAFPCYWATQGDNQNQVVFYWPPPVEAMEMEWDVIAIPKPLYTDDDYDLLPDGYQQAIKYGAAGLAYMNSRPQQALLMLNQYADILGIGRFSSDFGKTGNMYQDFA